MTNTLSGSYSTLVTLGSLAANPTTIVAGAQLNDGLYIADSGLSVVNYGIITGNASGARNDGVNFSVSGTFTNQSSGTISGYYAIRGADDPVTVVNAGSIAGSTRHVGNDTGMGVRLLGGGSVTNQVGGVISGGEGVYGGDGTALTVFN